MITTWKLPSSKVYHGLNNTLGIYVHEKHYQVFPTQMAPICEHLGLAPWTICNINSDDVNKIITPCFVKIENIAKLPLHKQNKPIVPIFHKSRTCTQSEVKLPLSQQACRENVGVSNYEAFNSGNLPYIPKLTSSSHIHPFRIKNPKNRCFVNVVLLIIIVFWEPLTTKCI